MHETHEGPAPLRYRMTISAAGPAGRRTAWALERLEPTVVHFNGSCEALHVVERFTRVDDETLHYEFTVEDPTAWTRSWSAEYPLMKRQGPLFEYACHEGNYDLRHILEVARHLDETAAAKDSK